MSLTFIGQPDGAHIKAAVLWCDDPVSVDGPLWFTLDQWHELKQWADAGEEASAPWVTTPDEYEVATGERVTP